MTQTGNIVAGSSTGGNWYYLEGKQRFGPMPFEHLKQVALAGRLAPSHLVWREGMPSWVAASTVKGLFASSAPTPSANIVASTPAGGNWYYMDGKQRLGPMPFEQLRQVALSGRLAPTQLVCRDGMPKWVAASTVEGLLAVSASTPLTNPSSLTPPSASPGTHDTFKTIREHPAVIATMLFFCCFPAGLTLVWTHSVWSKGTKILWTVGWVCLAGVMMAVVADEAAATRKLLADANISWESGKQAEAVVKYEELLSDHASSINEDQRRVIYRRVIDFDAEHGKSDEARAFLRKALRDQVAITLESPSAKALLAQEKPSERIAGKGHVVSFRLEDHLTSEEKELLKHPVAKRSGKGLEFERMLDPRSKEPLNFGTFFLDGSETKSINYSWDGGEPFAITFPNADRGSTKVYFSQRQVEKLDAEHREMSSITYFEDGKVAEEKAESGWTTRYYDNGQKEMLFRSDPREANSKFWDRNGREIDHETYCRDKYGPDWRRDYNEMNRRGVERNMKRMREVYDELKKRDSR